ncbi:hypothetical protein [Sulfitobacter dubius]|uniref:hypothetical protein n=1 Tax=Sulfitobacter dubius TaxID=218673 RepID=UPI0008E0CE82|nr:hypothetical protein [Sulfitobacter dubius]SFH39358.1 hypothetical protein SAMN04488039_1161 [Sulfitobacter dubius]
MVSKKKLKTGAAEPKRLPPTAKTLRELFLLSGNECAWEGCNAVLIDSDGTMIGDIAHIEAAMPGGERFNPEMTNEQRRSPFNLMLLCASHHRKIDGKNSTLKPKDLRKIKAAHEKRFRAAEASILKRFEAQFPDLTANLSATRPQTLAALLSCPDAAEWLSEEETKTAADEIGDYADRLSNVPPEYRQFILAVIKRCATRGIWQNVSVGVPCADLQGSLGFGAHKLRRLVSGLEDHGMGSFGEDINNLWTVDLTDPSQYIGWADIHSFCEETDVDLEQFVIEAQFGLLDEQ